MFIWALAETRCYYLHQYNASICRLPLPLDLQKTYYMLDVMLATKNKLIEDIISAQRVSESNGGENKYCLGDEAQRSYGGTKEKHHPGNIRKGSQEVTVVSSIQKCSQETRGQDTPEKQRLESQKVQWALEVCQSMGPQMRQDIAAWREDSIQRLQKLGGFCLK